MVPKLVNKRTARPREGDVYIGRPSLFGNPFETGTAGTRAEVIAKYKQYFEERIGRDLAFRTAVDALAAVPRLVCWCTPLPCHGQVIIDYLKNKET